MPMFIHNLLSFFRRLSPASPSVTSPSPSVFRPSARHLQQASPAVPGDAVVSPPRCRPLLLASVRRAMRGVSPSTGRNYLTAARSLLCFAGAADLPLSAIDATLVRRYERWLCDRGISANTSSCYLRSLRAVCGKAVSGRRAATAFSAGFTGRVATARHSLDAHQVDRLRCLPLHGDAGLSLSLDLFLFSFYAMGMPLADMAVLRHSQVRGDTLVYRRRKTGRTVRLHIEPCMAAILRRHSRPGSPFLFPILDAGMDAGDAAASRRFASFLRTHNRRLKRLGRMAGIDVPLTSYTPRHTWASLAYARNVDLPVISKALGHTHTQTTLVYIREIDDRRVEQANRKLLESIGSPPLGKRRTTS